jgi:UDP-N-acetylmuramate: L-alanyl-gamma-D-glutamyl-meso-diaminopimelate ligase
MMGALNLCKEIGISEQAFFKAMESFKGASRRLEKIQEREGLSVYKDFAHSPSKVKATVQAVKEQFSNRKVIAALELHTFSSLNEEFLKEYKGAMDASDTALVFYDPKAVAHKKLKELDKETVFRSFERSDLEVFDQGVSCLDKVKSEIDDSSVVLLMSSGNFGGCNIDDFAKTL